jgi:hypothetical protein
MLRGMRMASLHAPRAVALALPFTLAIAACGASDTTQTPPAAPVPAASAAPPSAPDMPVVTPAPVASAAPAVDAGPPAPAYADPEESADAIKLTPLFTPGKAAPKAPAAKVQDAGCVPKVATKGDAAKDYAALTNFCGAPAGLVPYTKAVHGMLSATMDKTDTYVLPLAAGYCYRLFGTSDQTIFDLGLELAPAAGGAKIEDGEKGNVAVIDGDKAVCIDKTADYAITVDVESNGDGAYMFGVWARPAPKH